MREPAGSALRNLVRWLGEPRVAVPLLVVLALLLRLPNLLESLWLDEVLKSTHQVSSNLSSLWRYIAGNIAAPFYPVVTYFWVSLAGEHELIVRLPSLVLGLGSIVLSYLIARRLGASGLLTGIILCLSPAHVWYSQEATHYTTFMFFILVSVYVWPRVMAMPFSWQFHTIYMFAMLAAMFTHYYAAAFLLPFTLLSLRADKPLRNTILLDHVFIAAVLGLWLFAQFERGSMSTGQAFLRPFTIFEWWMLFFHWFVHGNTLWTVSPYRANAAHLVANPGLVVLQIAVLACVVRGLWLDREAESRSAAIELGLYLSVLPLALLAFTVVGFDRMYIERYMLVGLPFFAIAVARGATRFPRPTVRSGAAALLVIAGVASYVALLREDVRWTVYKHNPDWKSAAAFLDARNTLGQRIVLLGVIPLDDFTYHIRRRIPPGQRPSVGWYYPKHIDQLVTDGRTTQIVIVKNRAWSGSADRAIERSLADRRLRRTSQDYFKLVELHTFVPVTAAVPGR